MENLTPPSPLVMAGNVSENFKLWKQKFEFYYEASGASTPEKLSKAQKKSLLLHCLGEEALVIYNNFDNKEELTFEQVMEKIEAYCVPMTNETYLRHQFLNRKMKEGDTYDYFKTNLKKIAKQCNFKDLRDGLVRDQIITGIRDKSIKERLLKESELTLDRCISLCKASEAAANQVKEMVQEMGVIDLKENQVHVVEQTRRKGRQEYNMNRKEQIGNKEVSLRKCYRCGEQHGKFCIAYGRKCASCGIYGHYASMCRRNKNKKVSVLECDEEDEDELFVGTLTMTPDRE